MQSSDTPRASTSKSALDEMAPAPAPINPGYSLGQLWNGLKTLSPTESLQRLSTKECARNSLLVGIGGGAAIGVVRFAASRRLNLAVVWSLGSFGIISGAAYIKCQQEKIARQQILRQGVDKYMRERGFVKTGSGVLPPGTTEFDVDQAVMVTMDDQQLGGNDSTAASPSRERVV